MIANPASSRWSLALKLYASLGAAVLFAATLTAVGLWGMFNSNRALKSVYLDRVVPLEQLKTIADDYAVLIIDAVNKTEAGRFTAEEALVGVRTASERIRQKWTAYLATKLTEREAQLADEAAFLFKMADVRVDQLMARLATLRGKVPGQLSDFDGPLYDEIDPISGKITELVQLQLDVARADYDAAEAHFNRLSVLSVVVLGAGVVLFGVVGTLIIRSIVRPIETVGGALSQGSAQISAAASQVSSASQMLASGSSEQAASLEQITASVEELAGMTKRNAETAAAGRVSASQARSVAEAGVNEMVRMRDAIGAMERSSQDITKIIKTIDEIAFQTNILALNAAVEAARAGEAGAGFSVVAEEVRALARRSAAAARETGEKIAEAVRRSSEGVAISTEISNDLSKIVVSIRELDEEISAVASASHEQSEGLAQINTALGQLDRVTQSNAAGAEETAAAAEELDAQSKELLVSAEQLIAIIDPRTVINKEECVATAAHAAYQETSRGRAAKKSRPEPAIAA